MSKLVDRLRLYMHSEGVDGDLIEKAADKINELEEKVKRMQKDLDDWQEDCGA